VSFCHIIAAEHNDSIYRFSQLIEFPKKNKIKKIKIKMNPRQNFAYGMLLLPKEGHVDGVLLSGAR
jgi:hypothetical protein